MLVKSFLPHLADPMALAFHMLNLPIVALRRMSEGPGERLFRKSPAPYPLPAVRMLRQQEK
ncbi:MAG: hypothetical protein AB1700_12730 [Bacillota bacterium]